MHELSAFKESAATPPPHVKANDPIGGDPSPTLQSPASMEAIGILSHGARINGLIHFAAGSGKHPIVIILHGFPGSSAIFTWLRPCAVLGMTRYTADDN
jgi:pimeloyl-ACP methyl ester carboxylesterase